jgi:hypothetical protein
MRKYTAVFANFVCTFGNEGMIKRVNEIILPSFLNKNIREHGNETSYFFEKASFTRISRPYIDAYVHGRFIQKTKLKREQYYGADGLVRQRASLKTAPSAYFALSLRHHILAYYAETNDAPLLGAFEATIRSFARSQHKVFIKYIYESMKAEDAKITWKKVHEEFPPPKINIVALPADIGIDDFVDKFEKVSRLSVNLIKPNPRIHADNAFARIHQRAIDLGAESASLSISSPKEGLDKDLLKKSIKEATKDGNQLVKVTGSSLDGNKLDGDNHSFSIAQDLGKLPDAHDTKLLTLASEVRAIAGTGAVTGPGDGEVDSAQIDSVYNIWKS